MIKLRYRLALYTAIAALLGSQQYQISTAQDETKTARAWDYMKDQECRNAPIVWDRKLQLATGKYVGICTRTIIRKAVK